MNATKKFLSLARLGISNSFEKEENRIKQEFYEPILSHTLDKNDYLILNNKKVLSTNLDIGYENQHFIVSNENQKEKQLCRYYKHQSKLKLVENLGDQTWSIKPKNIEQLAALDLLMDPKIDIVILAGKAGTGKTLLALAAGLELILSGEAYQKILVSRPIYPMGKDMGYLPGDVDEKMAPWMQPVFDNLEFLSNGASSNGTSIYADRIKNYHFLLDKKLIELEALTYIRGRSISNRFMIIDEAQNLIPHEIKTIITRVGEGTKLVLTGDPYQIDNPHVQSVPNGLSYVIQKLKPHAIAGHVFLVKGERSQLAELASNIL